MGRKLKTPFLVVSFAITSLIMGLRGLTVAFIGSLLILVAVGVAYLWNRFVFAKLSIERTISRKHSEFDAPLAMQIAISNRKLLPLFGLKVEYRFSSGLTLDDSRKLIAVKDGIYTIFHDFFHLNWYEKRSRTYELRPLKRGRFDFTSGSLSYSDPFGFFSNRQEGVFPEQQLIIFPRVVPIKGIASLNTFLFGTRPKEGWIFTDPLNRIGTRPYQSTDSARMINWKASARHVQTQVHVEKPSFDQQVYLILEQSPELAWWTESVSNTLEVMIMAAASFIHVYSQSGYEIELVTNLVSKVHGLGPLPNKAVRGRAQRTQHLTNLALLQGFSTEPIQAILGRERGRFKPGSTVVALTSTPGELDPPLVQALHKLGQGSKVALVRVLPSDSQVMRSKGLKEWRIEGGQLWREMAALELS